MVRGTVEELVTVLDELSMKYLAKYLAEGAGWG